MLTNLGIKQLMINNVFDKVQNHKYQRIMKENQTQKVVIEDKKNQLVIPLPPIMVLPPPPPLSNYQYVNQLKMKHSRIINGQYQQFKSIQDQMANKTDHVGKKIKQFAIYAESTGQGIKINDSDFVQCQRCNKMVIKLQFNTHMSCHAAIILDNLLLGDKISAINKKQLIERNKVTHVVNAAYQLPNYLQKEGIKYFNLQLLDQIGEQGFISQICKGYKFIRQSHQEGGIVFVHCAVGKSRSVSVILIYLLHQKNIGIDEGLKLIKEKRPVAQPNMDYMKKLKQYEKNFFQLKNEGKQL